MCITGVVNSVKGGCHPNLEGQATRVSGPEDYLQQLVEEHCITNEIADVANRLPNVEMQEQAVERREAAGVANMEKIVSDLLNQKAAQSETLLTLQSLFIPCLA